MSRNAETLLLIRIFLLLLALYFPTGVAAEMPSQRFDVVVYGATPAGIAAAVRLTEAGKRVLVLTPYAHVGGMMSSGLGGTDHCNKKVVGGFARDFFKRIGAAYGERIAWRFEPHVAERAFEDVIDRPGMQLQRHTRVTGVSVEDGRIAAIGTTRGRFAAPFFIDASYEGDLMALAGVPFEIGRESRARYREPEAGVHELIEKHQIPVAIDPYDSDGSLLPGIQPALPPVGSADSKTMAYNFRLCITTDPQKRRGFPEPLSYDPREYELLARILRKKPNILIKQLFEFLRLPDNKYDLNSKGGFSTDFIGGNWAYPEAGFEERAAIVRQHREYTLGLFHFLQSDPRVPARLQETARRLGLCKDEFTANDNWPYQLYIRVARRMRSDFVLTQKHMRSELRYPDVAAVASCPIESHSVQRAVVDGSVVNEGWASKRVPSYQIPLRAMLPPPGAVTNLIVPVAISASHIAYSSLRMEPVFMALGESAGVAVQLALEQERPLRTISIDRFQEIQASNKQRLTPRE